MSQSVTQTEDRVARMMRVLRDADVRVTPQREAIYREVARTDEHPDAETVFKRVRKRMPMVSLDTVYRTLRVLEELGLIVTVDLPSARARFDANPDRHHHIVCRKCGCVSDFHSEELDKFAAPSPLAAWGRIDSVQVQLRGTCAACLEKAKK